MEKLQAFQAAAREGGFIAVEESADGTVMWLKKETAVAEDRMCLDSMTSSATVYWATMPWKINSRTFRAAAALQEWIMSRPAIAAHS